MSGTPISPNEVIQSKRPEIPRYVFEIFNMLIKQNWDGKMAIVTKEAVIRNIIAVNNNDDLFSRSDIFTNNLLEVDNFYRDKGWCVTYKKPAFNEFYDPFWIFSKD